MPLLSSPCALPQQERCEPRVAKPGRRQSSLAARTEQPRAAGWTFRHASGPREPGFGGSKSRTFARHETESIVRSSARSRLGFRNRVILLMAGRTERQSLRLPRKRQTAGLQRIPLEKASMASKPLRRRPPRLMPTQRSSAFVGTSNRRARKQDGHIHTGHRNARLFRQSVHRRPRHSRLASETRGSQGRCFGKHRHETPPLSGN
jgi:hypothetical protein